MSFFAVALWGAFMMAAIFYTREVRHRDRKPTAAYLTFATLFSLVAAAMFGGLTWLLHALDRGATLEHPLATAGFLLAVFVPAFLVADRQLRKPPRAPVFPDRPHVRRQLF